MRELTSAQIKAINAVLNKDQRVELIPTKEGIKLMVVRREQIKTPL